MRLPSAPTSSVKKCWRWPAGALVLLCVGSADAFSTRSVRFYGTGGGTRVDRIKVPVDPPVPADVGAGDFTVELWLRGTLADNVTPTGGYRTTPESSSIDWIYGNIIVDRDIWGDGPDWGMSIHRDASNRGVLRFGTEDGPPSFSQHTLQGSLPVLDGAWHHVAFVRERSTGVKRIYVDGVLDVASALGVSTTDLSYPNDSNPNSDSDPFLVFAAEKHGYGGASGFPSFSGWMDDIRVWNVARTGAQIDASRSVSLPPTTAGLALYLRLEEGVGQTLVDATGGDTATLYDGVPGSAEWRTEVPPGAGATTSTSSTSTSTPSTSSSSTSSSSSSSSSSTSTSSTAPPTSTVSTTSTSTSSTVTAPLPTTTIPPGAGPMAAYAFDEAAGGMVADATGRGNNGTVTGATWRGQGRYGAALSFDGNDSVTVPDDADLDAGAALTLEAWVNPAELSGYRLILDKTSTGTPSNYYLGLNAREVEFGFYSGAWRWRTTSDVDLVPGAWVHVAAVFDDAADAVRLYVNGVERLAATETATLTVNSQPLRIGMGFSDEGFMGEIDEVRVYRRTLTASEIVADMNTPVGGTAATTTTSTSSTSTSIASPTSSSSTSSSSSSSSSSTSTSSLPPPTTSTTIPQGLVGGWSFDEGTGNVVRDESGFENHGSITGAVFTPSGRFGGALSFDGSGDWVTVADAGSLDLTSAMTLEAWVFPTASGTSARPVVGKERASVVSYFLNAATSGIANPSASVRVDGNVVVTAGTLLPVNAWTHLAATFSGTSLRLYINGALAAERAASGAIATSVRPLRIGHNGVNGGVFMGRIDEVRVYARALTAQEIQADMTRPVP